MASVVDICNRALQKLGAKRITSLSQDSVSARACNSAYEAVRDSELRSHVWSFAIARAEIAADATAPDWGRANSFQLPSDFIRLADPYNEDVLNTDDFEIEGQKILTNATSPIYIRYVRREDDPAVMDSLFKEALSARLAVELCEEITQSNTKKDGLKEDYKAVITQARKVNAIERPSQKPPTDTYITCRS